MREFEYTFEDGLKVGLRRHHKNPRNSEACVEYLNMRVTVNGGEPFIPFTDVYEWVSRGVEQVWPLHQLICGKEHTFLVERNDTLGQVKVFEIGSNWSKTQLLLATDAAFGKGERFEIADFGKYILMTNGKVMVRRNPVTGVYESLLNDSVTPRMKTLCDFKGQIVGGNVVSQWHDCDASSIIWSDIGSACFLPSRRNEAGFRKMPQGGIVHRTRRLGDRVMVYGSEGINALIPVSSPTATFGLDELLNFGIVSSAAVEGDSNQHIFVDRLGWIWSINSKMELKKLGYQEFMLKLDPANIVVTHDKMENDFYISDGVKCFLLTPSGLSEVHQLPLSIGGVNGQVVYMGKDSQDHNGRVVTDTLDFGFRGLKTCSVVEHGLSGPHVARSAIDWRDNKQRTFARTPWTPLNNLGISSRTISGNDFRFCIETTNYKDMTLDYMKIRWKMTDLRALRGVYAAPARGQGVLS
jgi:hypothetical protein